MTLSEFDVQFDVLYNNVTSNQAPGLNAYEKSVFLTKAQNELVKNYFLPQSNPKQTGFEDTPIRQTDFHSLVRTSELTDSSVGVIDKQAKAFLSSGEDILAIINESVSCERTEMVGGEETTVSTGELQVIPISMLEYQRLKRKPYKYPLKGQAWRIISDSDADNMVEIIPDFKHINDTLTYNITYIKYPEPIILYNLHELDSSLSIGGKYAPNECELDPSVHDEILQRAVELAKVAWLGDLTATLTAGQRSE